MKLTKAVLRERRIFNSHDICAAGGGKIFITYRASESRGCIGAGWGVHGLNFKTDPGGHWADYGSKYFCPFQKTRPEALEEAQAWASAKYAIPDWERDPFGGWQDKRVMDRVRELVKAGGKV